MNPSSSVPVHEPRTVTVDALPAGLLHPPIPQAASSITMMSAGRTCRRLPMGLPPIFVETRFGGDENQARDQYRTYGDADRQASGLFRGRQISVERISGWLD